jgi:hypothetical protein
MCQFLLFSFIWNISIQIMILFMMWSYHPIILSFARIWINFGRIHFAYVYCTLPEIDFGHINFTYVFSRLQGYVRIFFPNHIASTSESNILYFSLIPTLIAIGISIFDANDSGVLWYCGQYIKVLWASWEGY